MFLRKWGWARFAHIEIYGLGSDVPNHIELISTTRLERYMAQPALPHPLLPVMNDGAGNHYCIDTAVEKEGESPIVFWDHETRASELNANCFANWLVGKLQQLTTIQTDTSWMSS